MMGVADMGEAPNISPACLLPASLQGLDHCQRPGFLLSESQPRITLHSCLQGFICPPSTGEGICICSFSAPVTFCSRNIVDRTSIDCWMNESPTMSHRSVHPTSFTIRDILNMGCTNCSKDKRSDSENPVQDELSGQSQAEMDAEHCCPAETSPDLPAAETPGDERRALSPSQGKQSPEEARWYSDPEPQSDGACILYVEHYYTQKYYSIYIVRNLNTITADDVFIISDIVTMCH